jgi:hypothetical protein
MNILKIFIATVLMFLGQTGSFLQLQGATKFGWVDKYLWMVLLSSIPISYLYIKSVSLFIEGFGGQIWPSRLIGFAIGIIVFTILSMVIFKEHFTTKTLISLLLAVSIVGVQIFYK